MMMGSGQFRLEKLPKNADDLKRTMNWADDTLYVLREIGLIV
jgi:hypothetical protein